MGQLLQQQQLQHQRMSQQQQAKPMGHMQGPSTNVSGVSIPEMVCYVG